MINANLIDFEHFRNNYEVLFENKEDYFLFVRALTEKNYNIFKYVINPKNLKRGWRNNHVDHMYSISEGYKNRVNPFEIAHPCNLQMLKAKENKKKNKKCTHSLEELKSKIDEFGVV